MIDTHRSHFNGDFSANLVQEVTDTENLTEEVISLLANLQPKQTNLSIICGRSKLSHHNEGNKWFRSLIAKYREPYQAAPSRMEKTRITTWIMNLIREQGGKFLLLNETSNNWEEASEDYIKGKISHSLRSVSVRNKKHLLKAPEPPKKEELTECEDKIDQIKVENLLKSQKELLSTFIEADFNF